MDRKTLYVLTNDKELVVAFSSLYLSPSIDRGHLSFKCDNYRNSILFFKNIDCKIKSGDLTHGTN